MYEFNELTYAAIITIQLPGSDQPVDVHVTLTPPDKLDLDGVEGAKLLKDCTLAELQQFAADLEAEVLEQYQQITLYDLAEGDDGLVKIAVINDGDEQLEEGSQWLTQSAIVFPTVDVADDEEVAELAAEQPTDNTADDPAEPIADIAADDPAPMIPEMEEIPVIDTTATADEAEADEEEPAEDASQAAAPVQRRPSKAALMKEIVAHETEVERPFEIIVLDTEPVHKEREAGKPRDVDADEASTAERMGLAKPKGRTAGERARLNDPMPHACDVLIDEEAFRGAQAHSLTSMNREVAGVLVGPHPEKQPDGRYVVHITDYIIAKHTHMQGASVTYTPESWRYVNDVMMSRYPEEECVIVGWYHTHPGFGIFLSNMDLFIHHNFFTQKWHLALVLDPVNKRSGFFTWDRKQKEVMAYPFPWPYWAHRSW